MTHDGLANENSWIALSNDPVINIEYRHRVDPVGLLVEGRIIPEKAVATQTVSNDVWVCCHGYFVVPIYLSDLP